jgi:ABC-type multidrug transport system ATPase subunit
VDQDEASVGGSAALLAADDIFHVYPGGTEALKGVSLRLGPGLFGLLGPNGAGKSTLMQVLATLLRPTSGSIRFGGVDVLAQPRALRRQLGYLPQDFGVYPNASAAGLLDHLAVLKGITGRSERRDTVERLLHTVNLWEVRDRAVASFSGGMRQRFGIAQALIAEPRLIILDEPTAGLDPDERNRFHDLLVTLGEDAVVILSTHIVEDVATLCERMAVLAGGRILFDGTPQGLTERLAGRLWAAAAEPAAGSILSSRLSSGRRQFRILADAPPAPGAEPLRPQLEDAYLAAVRGLL